MKKIKLFCIPYAGGSSAIYYKWKKHLHERIELFPVELAGRGKRFNEPYYQNMDEAVEDIYCSIKHILDDSQYAIFGYSMGSWIAFELYHKIKNTGHKEPIHIFFSARKAPHMKSEKILHNMDDDEFAKEIVKMGGTTDEIFVKKELFDLFVPILRADFKIIEKYDYIEKSKIECNITVLYGEQDTISTYEISEWRYHTNADFNIYGLDGSHFFINSNMKTVIDIINHTLI